MVLWCVWLCMDATTTMVCSHTSTCCSSMWPSFLSCTRIPSVNQGSIWFLTQGKKHSTVSSYLPLPFRPLLLYCWERCPGVPTKGLVVPLIFLCSLIQTLTPPPTMHCWQTWTCMIINPILLFSPLPYLPLLSPSLVFLASSPPFSPFSSLSLSPTLPQYFVPGAVECTGMSSFLAAWKCWMWILLTVQRSVAPSINEVLTLRGE